MFKRCRGSNRERESKVTHFIGEVESLETCEAYRQGQVEPTEPASNLPCSSYAPFVRTQRHTFIVFNLIYNICLMLSVSCN